MRDSRAHMGPKRWCRGKASVWHKTTALMGVAGAGTGVGLAVVYNWPRSTEFVTYFTLRPAWCWFAITMPLLAAGALGLRWRPWVVCAVVWLGVLAASEELVQLAKLEPREAEARFQSLRAAPTPDGPFAFRVITWNIAADAEMTGHAFEQIAQYDPDIVLLQECGTGSIVPDALAGSEHFKPYVLLRSMDNAVLSRWPVSAVDAAMPKREGHMVRVEPSGRAPIYFVNVHLPMCPLREQIAPEPGVMEYARSRLDNFFSLMRGPLPSPVIVAGDFNTPGGYADLRNALQGFADTFADAGRGWGKTIPAAVPMSRIDHVYLPAGFTATDCYALPTEWSDHRPVVADVIAQKEWNCPVTKTKGTP
jgi:vancomycin resistance protein VanJ